MGVVVTVGAIVGMVFLVGLGVACLIMGLTLIVGSLIEKYSGKKNDYTLMNESDAESQNENAGVTVI